MPESQEKDPPCSVPLLREIKEFAEVESVTPFASLINENMPVLSVPRKSA